MNANGEAATKLLSAASERADRRTKLVYLAEAQLLIDRGRQRLKQQALFDQIEAVLVRTATPDQLVLSPRGAK
jgi:hypothetical protein